MSLFFDNIWIIAAATALSSVLFKLALSKNKDGGRRRPRPRRRRTSLASALQVNRSMLEKHMGWHQNVVNAVLFFGRDEGKDEAAPSREDMVAIMKKLVPRFERLRCQPRMTADGGTCEWVPVDNLDAAIESAVIEDAIDVEDKTSDEQVEYEILQKVAKYKSEILPTNPPWRVIVLKPSAVLVRIDHCVGDGLTLVTLLKEIGTRADGKKPLTLSDLSPLLQRFEALGDLKVSLLPLKLLWPPSLWRAISLLASGPRGPEERFNPLRPPPEHIAQPIPAECYGTVYFPTIPLSLLKDLARSAGKGTTINDVVLFCLGDAVRDYVSQISNEPSSSSSPSPPSSNEATLRTTTATTKALESIRLILPIANPIRPSLYGDKYEGLCNRMTPVVVPLNVSDRLRTEPRESLDKIQSTIEEVKRSNTPLLMTTMNTLFERFIPLEKVYEMSESAFRRISCVYSTVPGPTTAVSISSRRLRKIQVVMPHPTSIFQMLSYDGNVFCNITLDMRTASRSWLLRDAFVRAVDNFASEFGPISDDVRDQIRELAKSGEWGGSGVVFSCGDK